MARDANARNVGILAALVVVLAAVVAVRLRPALVASAAGGSGAAVRVGSYSVPALGWDRTEEREVPTPAAGRNLFTFGAPPTPTPDRRPKPTPPPPPPPPPTPTPEGIYIDGKWVLPPPPRFLLTYLGWLGPDRLRVAVFRDGDDVLAVPVGDVVKGKFVVREVDPAAVTIGFVGYPPNVTNKVAVAR